MVTPEASIKQLKALFAGEVVYNLAQIMTKLSFLFLYMRIFKDALTYTRRIALYMMIFLIVWGVVQELLVGFACTPIPDLYPERKGHCIQTEVVWYLTSIMNIVTDFVIFLTPIPSIKHLQLRRKQKFLVAGVFCLGFLYGHCYAVSLLHKLTERSTCIISIVRLFTIRAALNTNDPTWDNVPTAYWSVIELNCGIICCSAATLRPLLRRIIPGLHSRGDPNYPYNKSGSDHSKSPTTRHHEAPDMYALPNFENSAMGADLFDGVGQQRPPRCAHHRDTAPQNGSQDGLIWPLQTTCQTCGWTPTPVGPRTDISAAQTPAEVPSGPGRKASIASVRQGEPVDEIEIMVTRETTIRESKKGKSDPTDPEKGMTVLGIAR